MEHSTCEKRKGRYHNPHHADTRRSFLDVLLWKAGYYDDARSPEPLPKGFSYPMPTAVFDPEKPKVTWINHSTFLIQIEGLNILTDPIWSERCSPVSFFGPKRDHAPPIALEDLPRIDLVLISHNHYDHLDKKTVKALNRKYPEIIWMVPSGNAPWFKRQKITNVFESNWWEERELNFLELSVKSTAVPAQHYSGRTVRDLNTTLWVGWVLEFKKENAPLKTLYFVGDTGYNPYDFKAVGKKWYTIDLSLIPIGCYIPHKFMSPVHIGPNEAVRIHQETGSRLSIGMHWKTFPALSDEAADQPAYDLFCTLKKENIDPSTFLAVQPGHAINW